MIAKSIPFKQGRLAFLVGKVSALGWLSVRWRPFHFSALKFFAVYYQAPPPKVSYDSIPRSGAIRLASKNVRSSRRR